MCSSRFLFHSLNTNINYFSIVALLSEWSIAIFFILVNLSFSSQQIPFTFTTHLGSWFFHLWPSSLPPPYHHHLSFLWGFALQFSLFILPFYIHWPFISSFAQWVISQPFYGTDSKLLLPSISPVSSLCFLYSFRSEILTFSSAIHFFSFNSPSKSTIIFIYG